MKNVKTNVLFSRGLIALIMLHHTLELNGEAKRVIDKNFKHNLSLLAHMGSDFDSYVVINNLTQWRTIVSLMKNGSSIVPLKVCN